MSTSAPHFSHQARRAATSLPDGQHCNSHLQFAELYALAGERDKALERLEVESKGLNFWMIFIRSDSHFNDLHDDPRFIARLRRINLQP